MASSKDKSIPNFTIIVAVDEDCEILLNGKNIGKTTDKEFKIEGLESEKEYLVEGINDAKYGKIKIIPTGQFLKRKIILKPKFGALLTKSKMGNFEIEIDGKSYNCPTFIKNIFPGIHSVTIKFKTFKFSEDIEIFSGNTTEYQLVNETLGKKVKEQRLKKLESIVALPEDTIEQCRKKIVQLADAVKEFKEFNTEAVLQKYHKLVKRVENHEKEQKRREMSKKIERAETQKKMIPLGLTVLAVIIIVILCFIGFNYYNSYKNEARFYKSIEFSNSIDDFHNYLTKFGKSAKHASEVNKKIEKFIKERKEFEKAVASKKLDLLENYLSNYGEGAVYKVEVEKNIKGLKILKTLPDILKKYGLKKIKSGEFFMGSPRLVKKDLLNNSPQMFISVNPFYIGKYEVTFDLYNEYCLSEGKSIPKDNNWGRGKRPVINVSWYDANEYCNWLSNKTGFHFRLPAESEWEFACRANSTTRFYWGDEMNKKYCFNGKARRGKTHIVGSKKPNKFGLFDMSGNVYEWCEDKYESKFQIRGSSYKFPKLYKKNSSGNPVFLEWGNKRIIRGGDFRSSDFSCYSYQRNATAPKSKLKSVGFRVVMDIPQAIKTN